MDRTDKQLLHKARSLAGWSFLGIGMPIIGFILGGMSISTLNSIDLLSGRSKAMTKPVRKIAWTGIIVSLISLIATIGVAVWGYNYLLTEQRKAEDTARQEAQQQIDKKAEAERAKKLLLQGCLNLADTHYWEYVKLNATSSVQTGADVFGTPQMTYYAPQHIWDNAASERSSAKDDCYRKNSAGL